MQYKKRRTLTKEELESFMPLFEDLKSGLLEQELGVVYKGSREEALANLQKMKEATLKD